MIINFWGTRGSIPVADVNMLYYGGNTSCCEVVTPGAHIIVDAGTGMRELGDELQKSKTPLKCALLISHTHWDHIQGIPFFAPIYHKGNEISIYTAADQISHIREAFNILLDQRYHPVTFTQLKSKVFFKEFLIGKEFRIGDVTASTCITHHPALNIAFRLTSKDMSVVLTGDHEGGILNRMEPGSFALAELMKNADAAIVDAMYTDREYMFREGWGHSAYSMWIEPAAALGVKRLFFTHHNTVSDDLSLDAAVSGLHKKYSTSGCGLFMAKEGYQISKNNYLPFRIKNRKAVESSDVLHTMRNFSAELSDYNDVGMILDRILLEARSATNSDAGTIYLLKDNLLHFAYVHNKTLFSSDSVSKFIYSNATLKMNVNTIAGYAATKKRSLIVQDVYAIPDSEPYRFNSAFDKAAGYNTESVLASPVIADNGKLLGVIQLINKKDLLGNTITFEETDLTHLEILCLHAASAIDKGVAARQAMLRMLALTTLKDPKETNGHFQRVGAYSAEIFHHWAEKRAMDIDQIKRLKDQISVAAMLHDIGKVGIPDAVMQKPGKLTAEEFRIMAKHTVLGADIYKDTDSSLDEMVRTVALYHHEKWNGTGYRGEDGAPLSGEEIPWPARVVAIADVFDALSSRRVYKDAWSFEDAAKTIQKDAGAHFDPEMTEAFLEILDTIKAIQEKYADA
ncbi:MAG: HD domain-containing protein [Deferribacteraceae bacterium]|jgi:HD-GYP domain-containing protein (c-di-GMP phosphodiesterase class II)/phosphoribosyl 1,2-cyclic phosphodiesterase|nr:HD domain-containing protein [Deferribacteraceae bacterium]